MKRHRRAAYLSPRFRKLLREEPSVERDIQYWLIHVLHWHALLLAVIGILVIGVTSFGPGIHHVAAQNIHR